MSPDGASYRAAGVDYEVLDAGKRQALARALSTSPLLGERGGRALDASRGEPAFVFELDGRSARVRRGGSRHEGDDRPRGARAERRQPLRRRRLRHGRSDRQRPLLRRRAAARAERLLRHRLLGVVRARRARGGAASRAGRRPAATRARRGAAASRPRCPGCSPRTRSSWRAPPSARCPAGRAPILGEALAPGDEIVLVASSGLHANGASLARMIAAGLPDGYAHALSADGASFGEALLAPSVMYVPLVQALLERGRAGQPT